MLNRVIAFSAVTSGRLEGPKNGVKRGGGVTVCPYGNEKKYWSSDLHLHVSCTRWRAMRGSGSPLQQIEDGF